jgi:myo-inositol-1(or 4)-monophosphatase
MINAIMPHEQQPSPEFGETTLFAMEQARAAGAIHMKYWRSGLAVADLKNPRDIVTQADQEAETLITAALHEHYPDHAVLGEENGVSGNPNSDTRWSVDPLDGTSNFFLGDPNFAVLIAKEVDSEVRTGVMYFPATDEMYVAEKGVGAFRNNERLRGVRQTADVNHMYGNTQMSSKLNARNHNMAIYTRLLDASQASSVRNMHVMNACLVRGLIDVADGVADFHVRTGLNWWDYAAGKLLVEEAGGVTTDLAGLPLTAESHGALVASPAAHQPILDIVRSL